MTFCVDCFVSMCPQNVGKKMSLNDFVENLADLNDSENFPYDVLAGLYNSIRREPLEFDMWVYCVV